jgi:hypothetical protein
MILPKTHREALGDGRDVDVFGFQRNDETLVSSPMIDPDNVSACFSGRTTRALRHPKQSVSHKRSNSKTGRVYSACLFGSFSYASSASTGSGKARLRIAHAIEVCSFEMSKPRVITTSSKSIGCDKPFVKKGRFAHDSDGARARLSFAHVIEVSLDASRIKIDVDKPAPPPTRLRLQRVECQKSLGKIAGGFYAKDRGRGENGDICHLADALTRGKNKMMVLRFTAE